MVLDADSGDPLPAVTVTLLPSPEGLHPPTARPGGAFAGRGRTAVTSAQGRYRFVGLGQGVYRIRISRLGYRPVALSVELPAERTADVSVGLELEPVRLRPVSISQQARSPYQRGRAAGRRTEAVGRPAVARLRQRRYLTSDTRALTHQDVVEANTTGETDLLRALHRLPGVATVDDWTALLQVRGGRWDGTRLYFDGLPIYNPLHGGTALSAVNPDAIGSLFFHPGVRPPGIGGGGAAVVDVESRSANRQETRGYGELSLLSARFALDRPVLAGRGAVTVAARRSFADLVADLVAPDDDGFPYAVTDVTGRADVDFGGSGSLEASVLWARDDLFGDIADVAQGNRADWGNLALRFAYSGDLGGLRTRHAIGLVRYHLDVDTVAEDPVLQRRFGTPDFDPADARLDHWQLRGSVEHPGDGGEGPPWSAGYELTHRSSDYDGPEPVLLTGLPTGGPLAYREELRRAAVWADLRWRPTEELTVRPGLRVEVGEEVSNVGPLELAPRIRARLRLGADLALSVAAGRHFQFVQSMAAATGAHPAGSLHPARGWRLAGDTIPALRSDVVTAGVEWWVGPQWLAGLTLYDRQGEGALIPSLSAGSADGLRLVAGSESARGVEGSLRRLAGALTLSASYAYGVAEHSAGDTTYASPAERRHLIDLTAMWRPSSRVRFGAAFSAGSGVAFTRVFEEEATGGDGTRPIRRLGAPGGARGPGYATLDLLAEHTTSFDAWDMTLFAQLRNVLGRDNGRLYQGSIDCADTSRDVLGCRPDDVTFVDRFENGLPTVPFVGVRVAF